MASHPGFNFYNMDTEQNLYEDLVTESIQVYAHDVFYIPRVRVNTDTILNEVEATRFTAAYPVEVYIKNTDSFEGDGQLLSKFMIEVRDQMTCNMSRRSYNQFVKPFTNNARPWEGDLIFFPMLNVCYQIKYTKNDSVFYAFGKVNQYEIVLDLFENNGEVFATGNTAIDALYPDRGDIADPDYDLESENNAADNADIETAANLIIDFSEHDPFNFGDV